MPAPLAHPTRWIRLPAILKDAEAVFGRVSVVQMASESSAKERADGRRLREREGSARRIFSMGSWTPITPVEQTNNSCGRSAIRRAASSFVRSATVSPEAPVAQLALPALTTTARMRPLDSRRFFFERVTGAATTRFCVKTAAAEAGTSLEMSARSSAPVFLRPHAVAAKRNPLGSADSGGGWVISRRLPWAGGFRDQRLRSERTRSMCHRELVWRPARLQRSGRSKSRYQTRKKSCEVLRVAIRSILFVGVPLLSEFCRRHRAPGGRAHLCGPDSRRLQLRAVPGSKQRSGDGLREIPCRRSRQRQRRAYRRLDRARRRGLLCPPADRADNWWANLSAW